MNGKTELENQAVASMAATGMYMSAFADGTVSDLDIDEVCDVTGTAASNPVVVGRALGLPDDATSPVDPFVLRQRMIGMYCDALAGKELSESIGAQESLRETMKREREDSQFAYAGFDQADVDRAFFDADNGDMSAIIAAKERFYLG